jgi:haloacetate dehalogenase
MSIDGFTYGDVQVGSTRYRAGVAGEGPPVLLLHGFPETHYCWHRVAPALAETNTVVVSDLKGYGDSRGEPGGELGEGYSNRDRGAELVELMTKLGFERFSVVGHDRGGRVAYRMALDHPAVIESLAVLNVIPTAEQFERMTADVALGYWPFIFLAQPPPFAERVIGASAEFVLESILDQWPADPKAISADSRRRYLEAFNDETLPGITAEYRASFHIDRRMDAEDRGADRRIACPVLVHFGSEEGAMSDSLDVWGRWAESVEGGPLPSGHFIPEEAPEELTASLRRFLGH